LIPVSEVIDKIFTIRRIEATEKQEILFGRTIDQNSISGVVAALDENDNFVALLENKLQGSAMVAAPILVNTSSQQSGVK
jgi:tRNA pseudouridine55 synthase